MIPYALNVTFHKEEDADDCIEVILKSKYGCCCQKINIESAYRWEGELLNGKEILVIIKTFEHLIKKIEMVLNENHSYEMYQLTGCKMDYVTEKYLQWMMVECQNI